MIMLNLVREWLMSQKTIEFYKLDQVFNPLGFALGGEVEILFAPIAKRLQRNTRPNAQI